jgi:hypothetical protein
MWHREKRKTLKEEASIKIRDQLAVEIDWKEDSRMTPSF